MENYLQTAKKAADIGGKILLDGIESIARKQVDRKQQFDFVTQVDLDSEAAIIEFLNQRYPGHKVLAEESGSSNEDSPFLWIIDPLDGTKNYIHGFPMFAVSIALQVKGRIEVGAILDPLRDELFYAERGRGAFLNDDPIHVSDTNDFSRCLCATGFPFRAKHLSGAYFEAFISMFQKITDFRRAGAAAMDLAYVACGRLDGFWEITLNAWDIAAGALIIEEAGGKVTDVWGGDTHLQHGHIAASNGLIHDDIIDIVQHFDKEQLQKT